jgi:NitT/TauT family transport system substrate-binding protein
MKKIVTEGRGTATFFALPWLVAQEEGLFAAEGIEAEFIAPLSGPQARQPILQPVDDPALVDAIRSHSLFEEGQADVYSACEWGQIRRAQDSKRAGRILGKRSCVAVMALLSAPGSRFTHPQRLRNQPVSVSFHNANHYASLQMLEGFLERHEIKLVCQHHRDAYRSVLSGEVAAVALTEPWLTLAEKQGFQKIIETHYQGAEIGAPELDAETYESIKRAIRVAVQRINASKREYLHYLISALPEQFRDAIGPEDFYLPRLRFVDPEPYSREEFEKTYQWMLSWNLIPPNVKYENVVASTFVSIGAGSP